MKYAAFQVGIALYFFDSGTAQIHTQPFKCDSLSLLLTDRTSMVVLPHVIIHVDSFSALKRHTRCQAKVGRAIQPKPQ
jgi:hypothetical protein